MSERLSDEELTDLEKFMLVEPDELPDFINRSRFRRALAELRAIRAGQLECPKCKPIHDSNLELMDQLTEALKHRLVWTDEVPKEPGWYWWRNGEQKAAFKIREGDLPYVGIEGQWCRIPEPQEPEVNRGK